MFGGVEGDSTQHIGGVIAKFTGSEAMGRLMDRDGKNQGNRVNGDSLDRIVSNHGNMISIGAKK